MLRDLVLDPVHDVAEDAAVLPILEEVVAAVESGGGGGGGGG